MKEWWSKPMPQTKNKMYKFQQKLKSIKKEIKLWNKETFGNIITDKRNLELKIEIL